MGLLFEEAQDCALLITESDDIDRKIRALGVKNIKNMITFDPQLTDLRDQLCNTREKLVEARRKWCRHYEADKNFEAKLSDLFEVLKNIF